MTDEVVVQEPGTGLSQVERVVDTFFAPSKTFNDILRDASFWLPLAIGIVVGIALVAVILQKVGLNQLVDNAIQASPTLQSKMAAVKPDVAGRIRDQILVSYKWSMYLSPITSVLLSLLIAVILWPTINFVFGGKANYKEVFSALNYAFIPASVKAVVVIILLYTNVITDNFTFENMLGTSAGYYIAAPGPLKTFLSFVDIFNLWTMVLLSIGLATVARTKKSAGYLTVFGWWLAAVVMATVAKAVFG